MQRNNDDIARCFQPLADLIGEGKNPDDVHFPSLTPEEQQAAVARICADLDEQFGIAGWEPDPRMPGALRPIFKEAQ